MRANVPSGRHRLGAAARADDGQRSGSQHTDMLTYVPLDIIGEGSFGVVLHAKVKETGEDVAIKRVRYDQRLQCRELLLMNGILNDASFSRHTSENTASDVAATTVTVESNTAAAAAAAAKKTQSQTQCTQDADAPGVSAKTPHSPLSPGSPNPSGIISGSKSTSFTSLDENENSTNNNRPRRLSPILLRKHPNIVQLRTYYFATDQKTGEHFLHLVMSYLPTDLRMLKHRYFRLLKEEHEHELQQIEGEDVVEAAAKAALFTSSSSTPRMFPLLLTKALLFQLCRALAYLHSLHVCHRDLKPANIIVDPQTGRLQLCDFGSAKRIRNRNVEKNVSYICSRYYRAPELLFGALHYGCEVDMWSLGCIAAELLRSNGAPVFKGNTTVDQMAEIFKVLGAPSGAEMHAMNPQGAQAMQLTHEEFFPPAVPSAPSATTAFAAQSVAASPSPSASASASPTLNSDYYHCYNVLRVEALQWEQILHRETPWEAVDFVSKLLCYVPEKRMTAAAALEHPFFADLFSTPADPATPLSQSGYLNTQPYSLPRLPNGKALPVEMFMMTERETELYSPEFQRRMHKEVQRISSAAAAASSRAPTQ